MSDKARTIEKIDRFMDKARAGFAMAYPARCQKKFSNREYSEKWASYLQLGWKSF